MSRIAVAMSGGVDSSVTALLLMREGHEVHGYTMRHFDNANSGFPPDQGCDGAIHDALRVCEHLGISHRVIDVCAAFESIVIANFLKAYRSGYTPNPCVVCNPTIKWGVFFDRVMTGDYDFFATGHYVMKEETGDCSTIHRAAELSRDQSYMLWGLSRAQLKRTLFPLAAIAKETVRQVATTYNLPVAQKSDSQEICFVPGDYRDYLRRYIPDRTGDIVFHDGRVIGRHRGHLRYTLGQRRFLNVAWSAPLFVYRIDPFDNRVFVTDEPRRLDADRFTLTGINWLCEPPADLCDLRVQIRYNSLPVPVAYLRLAGNEGTVTLTTPARAITPGQSAVFYREDRLLGGGFIDTVFQVGDDPSQ